MDDVEFASLLCSRLCQNIIGPTGAINNDIEIPAGEDDPGMRAQIIDFIILQRRRGVQPGAVLPCGERVLSD
jgi:hypothetical protein